MKNVISNFKSNVNNSMSSIFTKEDVMKMLTEMESQMEEGSPSSNVSEEFLEKVVEQLKSIKSDVEDMEVDSDDVDFSIEGREIVVNEIEIRSKDSIVDDIDNLIIEIEEEVEKVS